MQFFLNLLDYIIEGFDYVMQFGPSVVMPVIIFIIGLALGAGFNKSLRAGLKLGVGLIGINLVIGLLGDNLGPAAQQMVERFGLELTVIDVGWPAAAAIAFASRVGYFIIPLGLAVNIIMLLTKTTKTVNVDIWNYWHFAFTGALVYAATNSIAWGLVAAAINMVIILVIADLTAENVQKYTGIPGVSLPHGFSAAFVPIAMVFNEIIDNIPKLKDIEADPESIQKRFGIFGEPMIIGAILGIVIGFLAGYDLPTVMSLGVIMGAVLVLIPVMARQIMEGLIPISESAQELFTNRFGGNKYHIGLDSAIAIGHPATMAASLILVPMTILLAVIVPGNKVLPFADLAVIPFMLAMIVFVTKGNVFRTVVIGFFTISVGLLIATNVAVLHTDAAIAAGFQMPPGATLISSICDGANPLTWAILRLSKFKFIGIAIMIAITGFITFLSVKRNNKQNQDIEA